ncbi:MAG: transketolase C-terminal domain-containing protein, partial [Candidatus Hydrogenedentes bacterium]|nr:transketolase C-terminal domain-containing protein [Candidatus Hydrogenedentota bacterium]
MGMARAYDEDSNENGAATMTFPINTSGYKGLTLDASAAAIGEDDLAQLRENIQIVRDTIVFFTAASGVKGLAGHTGGAYDIVPEVLIADGFMRGSDAIYPALFDEAGHRVAVQYAMAAFNGVIPMDKLLKYREYGQGLYGHPELNRDLGVMFSSGRLGHMWPFVNGVARANRDKAVFLFGSDGSQQEGNDAEASRHAVAHGLNVKLVIDDNNVTIVGHPADYLKGFDVARTLEGHGLRVLEGEGEDVEGLYRRMQEALATEGPVAVVNKRLMAPGVPGVEGSNAGHDVINKENAILYLEMREQAAAVDYLNGISTTKVKVVHRGSTEEVGSNRSEFGNIINGIIGKLSEEERRSSVFVIDSDLEGSTGLKNIRVAHPEVFCTGGVMERGNFSAAAGFGFEKGKQGIFSTFSAFLEMIISEATMARLNEANLLCHFSHAGVDEISDNTCHFGINIFFAHNGLSEGDKTRLYFPADAAQMKFLVERIYGDEGIRYVFTTRSKVPFICREDESRFFDEAYTFEPDKDDVIREGSAGYVISYGELLYRALDAVEQARAQGIDVGLINKPTLNAVDENAMAKVGGTGFALVVEGQNIETGLGVRYGTWLLERGFAPKYAHMGVSRPGAGG